MSDYRFSTVQLNLALARALGIDNTDRLVAVTLKVRAGKLPKVRATYSLRTPEGLARVTAGTIMVPRQQSAGAEGAPEVPATEPFFTAQEA